MPPSKLTQEKMFIKYLSLQVARIDLRYKLQLLFQVCFLLDYFLLFRRFLLQTLSMCLFAEKDTAQKPLLF